MRRLLPLAVLVLAGCPVTKPDTGDTGGGSAVDTDGDGWPDDADCRPRNANVHPGATETCNGRDDDCDDQVDEGLPDIESYGDHDDDGWGDTSDVYQACDIPPGFTPVGGDCDDTRDDVYPGAPEYCDGVDHDCDREVYDADAVDATSWFVDGDGDGWGDDATGQGSCEPLADRVNQGGDCDDADPSVHPEAPESCDDGTHDADCDGSPWCGPEILTLLAEGDAAGWELGTTVAASDLTGDGVVDLVAGAPHATGGGRLRVYAGPVGAGDPHVAAILGDSSGGVLAVGDALYAGDLDGDGVGDLAGSSPGADLGGSDGGIIGVFPGPVGEHGLADAPLLIVGASREGLGTDLAGGADLDGDGTVELIVASAGEGAGVYGFAGTATGRLGSADAVWSAQRLGSLDAPSVRPVLGDLDGDGLTDLAVGQPGADDGDGRVSAWFGPIAGLFGPEEADLVVSASHTDGLFGLRVDAGSDLDGDGRDDLVVRDVDGVWAFAGLEPGAWTDAAATARLEAGTATATLGGLAVGDVDADGQPDLLVGDVGDTEDAPGLLRLYYGPLEGGRSGEDRGWIGRPGDGGLSRSLVLLPGDDEGPAGVWIGATGVADHAYHAGAVYELDGAWLR